MKACFMYLLLVLPTVLFGQINLKEIGKKAETQIVEKKETKEVEESKNECLPLDFEDFTKDHVSILRSTYYSCLLYTSPSPRDATLSRMPSSA